MRKSSVTIKATDNPKLSTKKKNIRESPPPPPQKKKIYHLCTHNKCDSCLYKKEVKSREKKRVRQCTIFVHEDYGCCHNNVV